MGLPRAHSSGTKNLHMELSNPIKGQSVTRASQPCRMSPTEIRISKWISMDQEYCCSCYQLEPDQPLENGFLVLLCRKIRSQGTGAYCCSVPSHKLGPVCHPHLNQSFPDLLIPSFLYFQYSMHPKLVSTGPVTSVLIGSKQRITI